MVSESTSTRSRSNPALSLEEAFARLEKMKEEIGLNGPFSRETVVKGIGYSSVSGTSGRAVAALVHYGMLDRLKDMYTLSELGKKYLVPTSDIEREQAIEDAALQPTLFKDVFDDYVGQVLPNKLANILTVKYGIQYKVAGSAVKIIESSFRFAGLLGNNNILARKVTATSDPMIHVETVDAEPTRTTPQHDQALIYQAQPRLATGGGSRQGVNEVGEGWSLTVDFQNTQHLSMEMRKRVRALIEAAHELVDELYESDEKQASKSVIQSLGDQEDAEV